MNELEEVDRSYLQSFAQLTLAERELLIRTYKLVFIPGLTIEEYLGKLCVRLDAYWNVFRPASEPYVTPEFFAPVGMMQGELASAALSSGVTRGDILFPLHIVYQSTLMLHAGFHQTGLPPGKSIHGKIHAPLIGSELLVYQPAILAAIDAS